MRPKAFPDSLREAPSVTVDVAREALGHLRAGALANFCLLKRANFVHPLAMDIPSILEKKRDGEVLSEAEIGTLIRAFAEGIVPDYQMSAFAMAVYFQGMETSEIVALTRAMRDSGECFAWPAGAPRIVDKHSTGGVGDKVSLVLAPLLACDELWVPMICGRGLGITGGTLDKLESIPGFRVDLSKAEALAQLERIGVVMMGQTDSICPADKKLYALRDVTATVPSRPLIVASILSKKLAESLDALVIDVKYGSGAFMKTRDEALRLGESLCEVGEALGVSTRVAYHSMDEPTGHAVGNALEVVEAIETLQGRGPEDLRELVLTLAEALSEVGRPQLISWMEEGKALQKFRELVKCQGGDETTLEHFATLREAPVIRELRATHSGLITRVDAETIGRAANKLGAGRLRVEDSIDPVVGFDRLVKVGETVRAGEVLARVHAGSEPEAEIAAKQFYTGVRCE